MLCAKQSHATKWSKKWDWEDGVAVGRRKWNSEDTIASGRSRLPSQRQNVIKACISSAQFARKTVLKAFLNERRSCRWVKLKLTESVLERLRKAQQNLQRWRLLNAVTKQQNQLMNTMKISIKKMENLITDFCWELWVDSKASKIYRTQSRSIACNALDLWFLTKRLARNRVIKPSMR